MKEVPMFSLPFSFSSLPALSSRLGLGLMLAAAGTGSALYLFPSPSLPDFPPLPALAEEETADPLKKPVRPKPLPRRDPFRPLDHPVGTLAPGKKVPAVPIPSGIPAAPAASQPAPSLQVCRLLGILEMNGTRKALAALPEGHRLLGKGDELPGLGSITQVLPSALECGARQIRIGEVWP